MNAPIVYPLVMLACTLLNFGVQRNMKSISLVTAVGSNSCGKMDREISCVVKWYACSLSYLIVALLLYKF